MNKKIMIHCASGNTDRPGRWHGINPVFTNLGEALIDLGHEVHMMLHSAAQNPCNHGSRMNIKISDTVDTNFIDEVSPDMCITWNGNSDGDRVFINHVGKDKMVYGELGFFGHYDQTCYWDRGGINTRFSMIGESISGDPITEDEFKVIKMLTDRYMKPRLFNDRYIFVPLQDETDTQITQYSGYKTMDEFLRAVQDIYIADNRKILYKVHPRAGCALSDDIKSDPKFIQVTEDVHHYLPYADQVFGLNSTVMIETLLYHSNLVTYGAGIASRHFANDAQRMRFIATMYNRQFKWADLRNANLVRDSYLYKFFE
jgi:hypothetical protein